MTKHKLTIEEIIPLIKRFYGRFDNGAGGVYHVVLDDGNMGTAFIQEGLSDAIELGDALAIRIGNALLGLTLEEREELYDRDCRGEGW